MTNLGRNSMSTAHCSIFHLVPVTPFPDHVLRRRRWMCIARGLPRNFHFRTHKQMSQHENVSPPETMRPAELKTRIINLFRLAPTCPFTQKCAEDLIAVELSPQRAKSSSSTSRKGGTPCKLLDRYSLGEGQPPPTLSPDQEFKRLSV